jgi:hypothetical protein
MRAEGKSAAHGLLPIDHRYGDGALVAWSGADALEHLRSHVLVVAINHDRFKSPPGQFADRRVSIGAKFNANFQVAEDTPQHPDDLVVRT